MRLAAGTRLGPAVLVGFDAVGNVYPPDRGPAWPW
jgi:hypothetical protein